MFTSVALLVLAGLLGPLLAAGRRPIAPVLVGELVAGAVLGRTGLHWIEPAAEPFPIFTSLGFAMLMLSAGTEVDIRSPGLRQGAVRGGLALVVALVASVPVGLAIAAVLGLGHPQLLVVLLAGSSAAVAFPTIQERGLSGPAVTLLIAWITLADAVTALLMPLTLSGAGAVPEALLGDALIILVAAGAIAAGRRLFATGLADEVKRESKERHWALQLRISVLLLLVLAAIAEHTGASLLVAGFAAGIVLRQFHEPHRLVHQLTGLATGFFVPAFFVLLGATLDLKGLVSSPSAIALAVAMAVAATAVHVVAAVAAGNERRVPSGLLASAQLGLPAAAAALGLATGTLGPPVAAALVAGGCLTLIPATAGAMLLAGGAPAHQEVAR
jgi:Kef-type K+ transport system membrane component KefB